MHAETRADRVAQVFKRYALSVLWVGVAAWSVWLIAHSSAGLLSLTPFGLAIGISGCLGGFGPGALAVLLSAIALNVLVVGGGRFLTFWSPYYKVTYHPRSGMIETNVPVRTSA